MTQTTQHAVYGITGLTCLSCAQSAEEALAGVAGVRSVKVHFAGKAAEIEYDPSQADFERLRRAVAPLGYTLVADRNQIAAAQEKFMSELRRKVAWAVVLTLPLLAAHLTGNEIPGSPWSALVLNGVVAFYCGSGFFVAAFRQALQGSASMDSLVALGAGAAWVYDAITAFTGAHAHLESAAVIVAFVLTGKWLEEMAKAQSEDPRERLSALSVETARVLDDSDNEIPTSVRALVPGMRVRVLAGERFPSDGQVLEGETYADESMLSGEAQPVLKRRHDLVWGGVLNLSRPVVVKINTVYAESAVEKIIREVEIAESSRASVQRWIDAVVARFVPGVALLSVAAFIGTYFLTDGGWFEAFRTMLTVMVASCPCALGLATPVAIKVAVGAAAKRGILIRRAAALEILARVDAVAFDKTGTLTVGKPEVQSVEWNEKLSPAFGANLAYLTGALNESTHPLSKSLLAFLEGFSRRPVKPVVFDEQPGKGFQAAFDDGTLVTVGNAQWLRENRVSLPVEDDKKTFAAVNKDWLATFEPVDAVKPEARETVQKLQARGVECVMLTGDHADNAVPVAAAVGIKRVLSRMLPVQKADEIRTMQERGKTVAMVGDGINDSVAFAAANVGVAMGNGAQLAVRHADAVLMGGDLRKLESLFVLARRTRAVVVQNVVWAFGYNVVALPLAAGLLHPWHISPGAAGGLMALSSLAVVLNSLRLKILPKT